MELILNSKLKFQRIPNQNVKKKLTNIVEWKQLIFPGSTSPASALPFPSFFLASLLPKVLTTTATFFCRIIPGTSQPFLRGGLQTTMRPPISEFHAHHSLFPALKFDAPASACSIRHNLRKGNEGSFK